MDDYGGGMRQDPPAQLPAIADSRGKLNAIGLCCLQWAAQLLLVALGNANSLLLLDEAS